MKKSSLLASLIIISQLISPITFIENVHAKDLTEVINNQELSEKSKEQLLKKVPVKIKESIIDKDLYVLGESVSQGMIETSLLMIGNGDESKWNKLFEEGSLTIDLIIPIYNLEDNLVETMIIFNEGYIIIDSLTGDLIQYSEGTVDTEYFNLNSKVYSLGLTRFAVDENGIVDKRDTFGGKSLSEVKKSKKEVTKISKKENEKYKKDRKIEKLSKNEIGDILESQFYGADEGTSEGNFIGDPRLWLLRYYPNKESGITNLSVSVLENESKSVPEIDQGSSYYPEKDDCALVSTLEILNYHYGTQSQTNLNKAYSAMKNSEFFNSDGGVYWYHNDDLFKVAAEAIGKGTQSTSDDPAWKLGASYSTYKNYIESYGPSYLSMNHDPYGAHTVTVKGYARYKTTYRDRFSINRTFYDEFIRINDHWNKTGSNDAFLYLNRHASNYWYLQGITPN